MSIYSVHVDLCELLTVAVQAVLVGIGFIIQSPTSLKAHAAVTKLLQWCGNPVLRSFSSELAQELYACRRVQYKPQGGIPQTLWGAICVKIHKITSNDGISH